MTWKERYGPWAVVTGASSGIGREMVGQIAGRGVNVVLVARGQEALEEVAAGVSERHGVQARVCVADLADPGFVEVVRGVVEGEGLEVGLLVNNAGFTTTGGVLDHDVGANSEMIDVNCRAPLLLTHALAPAMRERGRGGVVLTASVMGWGGAAGWATYNATKGFDLLLAEGLAAELEPHGVDVVALCPGGTRSGFQAAGGVKAVADMAWSTRIAVGEVGPVAKAGLDGLGRRRVVVPGLMNKLMVFSMRFLPRRLNTFVLGMVVKALAH